MLARVILLVLPALGCAAAGPEPASLTGSNTAPSYTAAGLVQGAAEMSEPLGPNSLATLYGNNLSFTTHVLGPADLQGGFLPSSLVGVSVFVGYMPVPLLYVSPQQINFIMPYAITGTSTVLYVIRQNVAGPVITVPLVSFSPSFFSAGNNLVIAAHNSDYSLVTPLSPATGGEVIVFYAAGLGRTQPDVLSGEIVPFAATLYYIADLQVLLNGTPCDPSTILYAGLTPGYPGLYQINLRLPNPLPPNPTIQVAMGPESSPILVLPANGDLPTN
jgi:uncharacterized protein (TIGR03437 family)